MKAATLDARAELIAGQAGKAFSYLAAVGGMSLATAIFLPLRSVLDNVATVAVIQIVVVLLSAIRWGTGPAVVAALAGALAFNFFFLLPYHTFTIAGFGDIVFFLAFLATSLIVGRLAAQVKRRADEAESRRREIERLYADLQREYSERLHAEQSLIEAQDELVRKEKLAVLGQVAGSVGHELRSPLGVMNNAVYFLKTVLADADATTREYIDMIGDEIAAAERIVAELLDAVRTRSPQTQVVDVDALIQQTLQRCTVPERVTVNVETAVGLSPVTVDPQQMQQVLRNLISNGIDAMSGDGRLIIRATAEGDGQTVRVSIQDTGTGMAPEQLAKLFQPLQTTKARGIGLGLVVVKNLVEVNGGRIDVASELGKGTTFTVTLTAQRIAA